MYLIKKYNGDDDLHEEANHFERLNQVPNSKLKNESFHLPR